jgi:acyl-CoA thioesterase-1
MPSRAAPLALAAPVLLLICCATPSPTTTAPATTASPSTEARYLALGDSFTAGTGANPDQSFPARLAAHWGCGVSLLDLGVDGYTTDDLIANELPEVPTFAPQVITVAIGANDIVQGSTAATYRAHVHQILAAVVSAGVKRIVAIPQPDWSLSPAAVAFGTPASLHARLVDFNGILRAETEAVGGVFVDLFPLMETEAQAHMLASDGLHPSAVAYDAWGAALAAKVAAPCTAPLAH